MKNKIPILLGLMVAIGAIVAGFVLIPGNRSFGTRDKAKQIEKLIQENNYDAALEAADQWLSHDRDSTNAYWMRGQALEGLGRNSDALSAYQSCPLVEGDSASARCTLRSSEFYFQQGNATEVERYLKLALKAQGELVEANYQLYLILTLQARRWEGEPYLLKLAALRETDLEDLVLLTLSSLYISDPKGRELFPLSISGNERFRLIDARLAFDRNSLTEAETILRGILKQNPDLPDTWAWLGWTLLQQRNREALAVWNQSLPQRAADHPLCWLTRGMWYLQQDQDSLAARCFAEVLRRDSINSSATYQLAILLNRFGEADQAEKMSQRSLALHELEQLTHKLYTRKDQPELYTALKERIDTIPKSMEAIGRYIEAAAWQQWICGKNPGDANCLAELERLKALAAKTQEKTVAELSPLSGVDFEKWPLPDRATMQSAASSGSDVVSTSASGSTKWRNVAKDVGISFTFANDRDPKIEGIPINKATGGGVGVLDYDRDGWPDLYWTQGGSRADGKQVEVSSDALYRNLQGEQFQEIATKAFVADGQFGAGLAVGDFDCDGFPDLYIANQEQNKLWRNNGDGTFEDVTESAKLISPIWTTSALMVDVNGDALPDLFDVTYVEGNDYKVKLCVTDGPPRGCGPTAFTPSQDRLWINQGDGSFVEQSKQAGIHAPGGYGLGTVGADFSKSSRLDLFVANDESANFYFRNKFTASKKSTSSPNREAGFGERAVLEGVAFDRDGVAQACMGIAVDDADGDGLLDLFITNFYNQANILYLQKSNGFIDATNPSGIRTPSYRMLGFGTQFVDADLDGNPDLVVTNGHVDDYTYKNVPFKMPAQFFRNQGKGRFVEEKAITLGPFFNERYLGRGLATCDWNRDGREDILISHVDAPAALLQNESTEVGNYIAIEVVGTQSPRDGYGTTIEVEANGKKRTRQLVAGGGYQAVNEQKLILGIGTSEKIDRLKIRWMSGTELEMKDVPLNSEWLAVEGTGSLQRQR
jgi:tetratricopeptide (TPR) repeat protein